MDYKAKYENNVSFHLLKISQKHGGDEIVKYFNSRRTILLADQSRQNTGLLPATSNDQF